ncbi:unnamed protein product [Zymoseptoria tritici ST99CH_1A5]|uniref:F-box domain-containing protein n=4 Tax=Zymoseptoria tritici TaxID=1047171 RepID=F9XGR6_ZYMTI|nr:uncharacterized protein MYCGRDRAFT_94688 [Zymoseptoria tritici IPO323]SMQ52767.1 unnamed protein product [Zymoseptoria tritici ST99CH_3D7]SMR55577.1 unnamed protein product [Zymoseptoria tritici ST99CH_1E4]SMR57956.1 unnamed protein product [Zymoseptoria tritici ST99CH_3D1]SMY26390.1 unnamed protein product [Zymoseptoria tritici ST99CH_1A5]EGP85988.1 hypothetical protein MYCGRDRAFT_94688 [Zymoseptoria tritici IPO323]
MRKSARVQKQTVSSAVVSYAAAAPKKPEPRLAASCRHRCADKTACKHSCCQRSLSVWELPKFRDFMKGDMFIAFLDVFPVKELFKLRRVSKTYRDTIDRSTKYRKAAFLEAKESSNPDFPASIKDALLEHAKEVDEELLIRINDTTIINAPARRVFINPHIFSIVPANRLADVDQNRDPLLMNPHNYTADGISLFATLELKFEGRKKYNPRISDESLCMDMFLTQPPVKEVLVKRDATRYRFPRTAWPDYYLATDGDGLRYRDLNRILNMNFLGPGARPGNFWNLWFTGRVTIPRCEALDENGEPNVVIVLDD